MNLDPPDLRSSVICDRTICVKHIVRESLEHTDCFSINPLVEYLHCIKVVVILQSKYVLYVIGPKILFLNGSL